MVSFMFHCSQKFKQIFLKCQNKINIAHYTRNGLQNKSRRLNNMPCYVTSEYEL